MDSGRIYLYLYFSVPFFSQAAQYEGRYGDLKLLYVVGCFKVCNTVSQARSN